MQNNKKFLSIVAGILFFWRVVEGIRGMISMLSAEVLFQNPLVAVMSLYGIIVLSVMGVFAIRQKPRNKLLNVLGFVYIGYCCINLLLPMPSGVNVGGVLPLIVLCCAFYISQKASGGEVFDTRDTLSEAAKEQVQAMKQTTIYDEQLQAGILTQEEYDQIVQNQKK